ncbi:MAG: NAD-dependent succinate-semialdehyde dehydrogenase [bacterium]|nr:NAD-dependent succinate-semialdehyde dehydrogenase [bacterium]
MPIQTKNPFTEKVERTFSALNRSKINLQVKKGEKAYELWSNVPLSKRVTYIKNLAKLLRKNKEEYAKVVVREVGKPLAQAISEIEKSAWNAEYIAEHGPVFLKDEHIQTEAKESFVRYEPLGIVLAIMPWNFPMWQVFRFASLALLAGNVCILKHASNVPQTAMLIEKILRDAGIPKDVFQSLFIESKDIEEVIKHDSVQMVILTGSEKAGSEVGALAGKYITKSVLELGGADPYIILNDADLEKAVREGTRARMNNAGQVCNSPKRFIIEAKVYDKVRDLFIRELDMVKVGDPMDTTTTLGPIAREDIREELDDQIKRAVKKGAKVIRGGRKIPGTGYFYEPTLLDNVTKNNPAFTEEIFGPVISLIKAKDWKEALQLANDHVYGLGGAVWTKNMKIAKQISDKLVVGTVAVNSTVASDPRLPFGGSKRSGYGREMSSHGIREFTNIKTIIVK